MYIMIYIPSSNVTFPLKNKTTVITKLVKQPPTVVFNIGYTLEPPGELLKKS